MSCIGRDSKRYKYIQVLNRGQSSVGKNSDASGGAMGPISTRSNMGRNRDLP